MALPTRIGSSPVVLRRDQNPQERVIGLKSGLVLGLYPIVEVAHCPRELVQPLLNTQFEVLTAGGHGKECECERVEIGAGSSRQGPRTPHQEAPGTSPQVRDTSELRTGLEDGEFPGMIAVQPLGPGLRQGFCLDLCLRHRSSSRALSALQTAVKSLLSEPVRPPIAKTPRSIFSVTVRRAPLIGIGGGVVPINPNLSRESQLVWLVVMMQDFPPVGGDCHGGFRNG